MTELPNADEPNADEASVDEPAAEQVPAPKKRWVGRVRSTGVVILLVLATILALLTPVAVWGRNLLLDTDRYTQTLAPLASDPAVQDAVIKAVDKQFAEHTDVKGLAQQALPPAAAPLAGPIANASANLVNSIVTSFVQSDAFPKLWESINRTAHSQVVNILTGKKVIEQQQR